MHKRRLIDGLALLAGLVTPLAFKPFGFGWLIFLPLVVLTLSWFGVTPQRAAIRGALFGLGAFGVGTSWVYVSLQNFGGMPPLLAALAVLLFVVLLSAFVALAGYLSNRILHLQNLSVFSGGRTDVRTDSFWLFVITLPAVWTLTEWARSLWILSFPWLSVGYSQSASPLKGLASIGSVYAVGFAVMMLVALMVGVIRGSTRQRVQSIVLAGGILIASVFLDQIVWVTPDGESVKVGVVQANIPIEDKWRPERAVEIEARYLDMSQNVKDAQVLIWPEAALPRYVDELSPDYWQQIKNLSAPVLFGAVERIRQDNRQVLYNSVFIAKPDMPLDVYRKSHLVAFGEYVPFGEWMRGVVEYMAIPMSDFRPWREAQGSYEIAGVSVGVSICYEDSFPEDIRASLPDAKYFINVSEDAWFGDSFGPHQRLQMAQFRSIESGRPMVRSSNTGITAIIDHRGRITDQLPQFESIAEVMTVQPVAGATPFSRFGQWPVLILSLLIVAVATRVVAR